MLLRRGSSGKLVKELQHLLGLKADGLFGPITEQKVIQFQTENNLVVDGIVGSRTWNMLYNLSPKKVQPIFINSNEFEDDSDPEEEMMVQHFDEDIPTSKSISELINFIESSEITRKVDKLVFHCTATPPDTTISSILHYWRSNLKWKNPGYHIIIKKDGSWTSLLDFNKTSNGVYGINSRSIHVSYIGGIDQNKRPLDNRTDQQKEVLEIIYKTFHQKIKNLTYHGHNEFSNKDCPCFVVRDWIRSINKISEARYA